MASVSVFLTRTRQRAAGKLRLAGLLGSRPLERRALVYNRAMTGEPGGTAQVAATRPSAQVVEPLAAVVEAVLAHVRVGNTLVMALSGGADSVVLAHVLHMLRTRRDLTLHLAHFDHALRPTSTEDARFAAELATAWGLPFHTARWAHGDNFPGGVEAAARNARYTFLTAVARSVSPAGQPPCVVVAHHADDQAETLLMNLVRGSGLHGLAGMRMVSFWGDGAPEQEPVTILRPLLRTPRAEILAYAAAHGLTWREDESNLDVQRTRNFVRHQVLPLLAQANPAISATLARTASLIALEAERLDALDARLLAQTMVIATPNVRVLLRYAVLQAAGHADRCAILRSALLRTFSTPRAIGLAHIEAIADGLDGRARATGPHPIMGGLAWSVLRDDAGDLLSLHRADALPLQPDFPWLEPAWRAQYGAQSVAAPGATPVPNGWELVAGFAPGHAQAEGTPPDRWQIRLDPAACGTLRLTTPRPGLRMAPLGMNGHTRTLGDIFTDRKVAPALRSGWPVIVDEHDRVIWLCGLVAAEGAAAQAGARALHLRWLQTDGEAQP